MGGVLVFLGAAIPGPAGASGADAQKDREPSSRRPTYAIQLSSFQKKSNAEKFIRRLKKTGMHPFLVVFGQEEAWYRVQLGPYSSYRTALQIAESLKKTQGLPGFVLRLSEPPQDLPTRGESSPRKPDRPGRSSGPSSAPDAENLDSGDPIDVLISRFLVWLRALEEKKLEIYFSFYSPQFEKGGKSLPEWRTLRKKELNEVRRLQVDIEEIRIREKNDRIEMSFLQSFQSVSSTGLLRTTLVWQKEGGQWKIIQETARPA